MNKKHSFDTKVEIFFIIISLFKIMTVKHDGEARYPNISLVQSILVAKNEFLIEKHF